MRTHRGRTDLEEKSSDDEREVYKGTPSEETAMTGRGEMLFPILKSPGIHGCLPFCRDDRRH